MGRITCPGKLNHPWIHTGEVICCWRCGRCPKEYNFRLLKGDYCPECTDEFIKAGYVWDDYCGNYVLQKSLFKGR